MCGDDQIWMANEFVVWLCRRKNSYPFNRLELLITGFLSAFYSLTSHVLSSVATLTFQARQLQDKRPGSSKEGDARMGKPAAQEALSKKNEAVLQVLEKWLESCVSGHSSKDYDSLFFDLHYLTGAISLLDSFSASFPFNCCAKASPMWCSIEPVYPFWASVTEPKQSLTVRLWGFILSDPLEHSHHATDMTISPLRLWRKHTPITKHYSIIGLHRAASRLLGQGKAYGEEEPAFCLGPIRTISWALSWIGCRWARILLFERAME